MNTAESLYRFYRKFGSVYFKEFIGKHPEYKNLAKEVLKMAKADSEPFIMN